jgi:hypothetical protein
MSLTIEKLQQLCERARIYFGTGELIIAGGAPRDVLSGVQVKDIDVFIRMGEEDFDGKQFAQHCRVFATVLGGTLELRPSAPEYPDIFDLADIHAPNGLGVVQMVGLYDKSPIDDVVLYDFGLSQVFVTPKGLFFTEAAIRDRQNKTITYLPSSPNDAAVLRSKARLERLRQKYIGWTFANCESLDAISPASETEQLLTTYGAA